MNNNQPHFQIPSPRQIVRNKTKFFSAFNFGLMTWASLMLIYYIVNTVNQVCNSFYAYYVVWTCSYALQILIPIVCIKSVRSMRYFNFSIALTLAGVVYKIVVVLSLVIGAWNAVGLCSIANPFKLVILVTNIAQILCLTFQIVAIWRIKKISRQLNLQQLIQSKTFAQN